MTGAAAGGATDSARQVLLRTNQQAIWTSQRLHPEAPLANMAYRIRIDGHVDAERLVRAFDTVVRAADVLRLVVDLDGRHGRILDEPPSATEVLDVAATDVASWAADRVERPVDATRCVYDSALLRHAPDDWTWWLDLHHVATDAWSSALVYGATALAYEHDDGDAAVIENEFGCDYFGRASTPVATTDATHDHTRSPVAPYGPRGRRTSLVGRLDVPADLNALAEAVSGPYRSLSRELSLLAISAMAVAQTVRRLDGRRTVRVGVPLHHRSTPDDRRLIGPLMEIHSLDVEVDDEVPHREQFRTVSRSLMELLRTAKPGAGDASDIEIVLNVFSANYGDLAGRPVTVEWTRARHAEPQHVIGSQVFDHGVAGALSWQLDVNHALSADDAWHRLPAHLAAVLDTLVDGPDDIGSRTPLVRADERADLDLLGAGHAPPPVRHVVHEQIRDRLRAEPGRVVAEEDGRLLEAGQLDQHADAVARWLAGHGVGPGARVGVRLPRSLDVLIAIHGVLRVGAAFVMLDPDDPQARHDAIAGDAQLALVIDELPPDDRAGPFVAAAPVGLDDLAYVLYTSGSTGVPKGVPISHRGLADYLRFAVDAYVDHDEPVVALHSSLVFDLTITSLFLAQLTNGRTLVVSGEPIEALGHIAHDDRVTVLKATPSQLELFTRLADTARPLRTVIVGGEAFRRPTAERLREACTTGVRIFNEYGPTEAVVGCMIHRYDPTIDTRPDVPIGGAAPGCEVRVLDEFGHLAPSGSWGELWVRRDGMATGYLHLPEQSAERFVDLDGDERTWYRTGDRVRVERPGVLTYGGRLDDQMKVGGVRLEPAEVETVLVEHPNVVAALVRNWNPGTAPESGIAEAPDVLTAWYQSGHGTEIETDELRSHLRARLPEHAVPAAFVLIGEVPLAASAKADIDALPTPSTGHRVGSQHVAPTTSTEQRVCDIWSAVLDLDAVGVTDDFFDIGGASLAALDVVARINAVFGTDLPDAALFDHRTVAALADLVDTMPDDAGGVEEIPRRDDAPLSAGEEAMLFEYRSDPQSSRYCVTRIYTIDGTVDLERLRSSIRAVVMTHGPLHTSYAADRRRLRIDEAVSFEHLADTDDAEFEHVHRSVEPFDLDNGPLTRVRTANTGPNRAAVSISMYHITVDASTFDLLWDQIADHYADGRLPSLESTYAEHGAWQRRASRTEAAAYWSNRSAVRPPAGTIGFATPDDAEDGYVRRRIELRPRDLVVGTATPFAVCMAATAATLAACSAEGTVEFGVTASIKDHPASAPLVGYTLNTLPITADVDRQHTFEQMVRNAMASVRATLPHRTYPLADIVRDARAAGHEPPNVEWLLAYQGVSTPTLADAHVSHRIVESGVAVADLSLIVQELEDSIEIGVEYRGTVLDEGSATRVLDIFESVLVQGVDNPRRSIAELLRPQLAGDIDGAELPVTTGVLDRFLDQVATNPDAPAVIGPDCTATYGELAGRIDALCERLVAHGQVHRVGITVGRSTDLVVAILAAQFAGAAYVPLDPEVGPERLATIADQAGLDLLVRAPGLSTHGLSVDRVIDLPPDHPGATSDALDSLRRRAADVTASTAAYVIFTSGSTGRPRGIEVRHEQLAASTAARSAWYDGDPDRFLLTSSVGFDSSIVGLFWPLTTGGAVVIPGDDDIHDVDRLGELIEHHGVSHTLMVPSLYGAILRRRAHRMSGLQVAIVAGETCPTDVVTDHHERLPTTTLVNEYGPTEATVWATAHVLGPDTTWVPIGTPIPGVTIRLADAGGAPVPDDIAGELLIAGPTVTAGYLDDDAATAARFTEIDGRRWYRTGDRARRRNGALEFVGRIDDQLNVGGVRLEPGDVERVLREQPGVGEALVVAVGEPPVLVAHLETGGTVDEARLRDVLTGRLAPGMVPRHFVAWPALPRSAHGKLDRRAAAALPIDIAPRAPQTGDTLDPVLEIWAGALRRTDIDPTTDFFAAGGDSLAAAEIVTRLGELTGREVGVGALLAAPTPDGLARAIGLDGSNEPSEEFRLVTIRPGTSTGPLVVLTPAWDDLFGYQALAGSFQDEITVMALTYHEQPGRPLVTTVDDLVTAAFELVDDARRTRQQCAVVGWSVGGVVAAEISERLSAAGSSVAFVAAIDTFFPGEYRHLWSNRWWKYKSMLRPGSIGLAAREFVVMFGRRIDRISRRLRRRLALWSGADLPDEPERTSVGGFPVAALDHPIDRIGTPMVFYSAADTNPERTVVHWRRVADDLTIVSVDGRHRGHNSIMGEDRVGAIGSDISARLLD